MEMVFDLEEIILYLNANEPTGRFCKNIENLKNKLLKAQEQEKALKIIKEKCVYNGNLNWIFACFNYDKYKKVMSEQYTIVDWNDKTVLDFFKLLTREEFDLVKEMLK
jgi:hypothetical protein